MTLEEKLAGWTGPSSDSEQEKQERAERMVREAVKGHAAFDACHLRIYPKGSYRNNTNVRSDSDVDIAVECTDLFYFDSAPGVNRTSGGSYTGRWTPAVLRSELEIALKNKFPGDVDASGSTAIRVGGNTARVDTDVVPCFSYRYYTSQSGYLDGTKVFKSDGRSLVNYPQQQYDNGVKKNNDTKRYYKQGVRILKRIENALVDDGRIDPLASYFVECLAYNVPDDVFMRSTWEQTVRGMLVHIFSELEGEEPDDGSLRWLEVNRCKYLFGSTQSWTRAEGRQFALLAWNFLGLTA